MDTQILDELQFIQSSYTTPIDILEGFEGQEGLKYLQKEKIRLTEFYSNSRYMLSQYDENGKEKPFYNTQNAIRDVENSAKEIDTKDIQATADEPKDYDKSFLLSKDIFEWMKVTNFGVTINNIVDIHTAYGGVLAKKCVYDGEISVETPEWKNLVTDQVDIANGVIVETHFMRPVDLQDMEEWDQAEIKKLIKNEKGGLSTKRIPIYEIRGQFPQSFVTGSKDDVKFTYQYHVVGGSDKKKVLYQEDNTQKIYKFLARKKKAGRALGVGVYEEGEQAQVWTNDAVQKQQRALDYSSKVVLQSATKKLKGRNAVTEVENGIVLETDENKPITNVNLIPTGGMVQFENLIVQWNTQLEKASSAFAAQRGETPPSGTPFRLQAQVLQQSSGVFEVLKEEIGMFIGDIFQDWIIPHLAKKINKQHILSHSFSTEELMAIDKSYSTYQANEQIIEKVLKGEIVTPEDYQFAKDQVMQKLQQTKSHRFIDVPEGYYKDLKTQITVDPTGEKRNKAAVLETLNNLLMTVAKVPTILQDPVMAQIFTKIVELSGSGISPMSLISGIQQQAQQPQPQQAQPQESPKPQPASLQANPVPA